MADTGRDQLDIRPLDGSRSTGNPEANALADSLSASTATASVAEAEAAARMDPVTRSVAAVASSLGAVWRALTVGPANTVSVAAGSSAAVPAAPAGTPVAPAGAPVAPAEAPVAPAEAPVAPAEAPVAPAEAPVAPAEAPVAPAEAPVAPAEAAAAGAPVAPAGAPVAPAGAAAAASDSNATTTGHIEQAPTDASGSTVVATRLAAARVPQGHYDLLRGTLNPDSPLALLRGNEHVWTNVLGRVDDWYTQHIDRESKAYLTIMEQDWGRHKLKFPKPTGIKIVMMPIITSRFTDPCFPDKIWPYMDIIAACIGRMSFQERHNTLYLTIREEWVPVGEAQGSPGLYIGSPVAPLVNGGHMASTSKLASEWSDLGEYSPPVGGMFMASNIASSTRIWPVVIQDPADVADKLGGIEHMRERLGPGRELAANELCWFTDRTPHESLPLQAPERDPRATCVCRQFFQLVAGEMSVWYSKHCTPNPEPMGNSCLHGVRISDEDLFPSCAPAADATAE